MQKVNHLLFMTNQDYCHLALAVIENEAQAISKLAERIDKNFVQACHYLLKCSGRIVVLGIGKSGHIGNKIAATLASTGSPAFFVHPAEASHGDMGMITKHDVVLALSYSGETSELITLIPLLKRLNTPLISLTGNANSTLAKAATVNIDVSIEQEACPLGLAPTTSTTAMLVMGDALAIALLQARGFTAEDFARSHPGGSLGRRLLLRVDDIMLTGNAMPQVLQDVTISEALLEITRKQLGMTMIVNAQGQLLGIYTDGDLRRTLDRDLDIRSTSIQEVMTTNPRTIKPNTLAMEALTTMETFKITSLVVVDDQQQPQGIVHMHHILNAGVV
ncbi:MAG: KpsF/GutQ family sugar-phosphate isomerase [Gammaproteobacteria bacterium]